MMGVRIFLFTTASRTALGPTQPPIQWVSEALSLGVKQPGREAGHSLPSSAEVKKECSYTSTPPLRLHGAVLCWSKGTILTFLPFKVQIICLVNVYLWNHVTVTKSTTCLFVMVHYDKNKPFLLQFRLSRFQLSCEHTYIIALTFGSQFLVNVLHSLVHWGAFFLRN
jgi:hypothetical protein